MPSSADDDQRPVGRDGHAVELIEIRLPGTSVSLAAGPVAGDLAAGGGDDELAGAGGRQAAQEARDSPGMNSMPDGLQRAVGRSA